MKSLPVVLVVAGLLGGCSKSPVPYVHSWFIDSYDNGVITVQHEGYTYKASCDTSQSFNNAASITIRKTWSNSALATRPLRLWGTASSHLTGRSETRKAGL